MRCHSGGLTKCREPPRIIGRYEGIAMIRCCANADFPAIEALINEAAQAYRGVIPADCWHEPYMTGLALKTEVDAGVNFWGWEESGTLFFVIGIQHVRDVHLFPPPRSRV